MRKNPQLGLSNCGTAYEGGTNSAFNEEGGSSPRPLPVPLPSPLKWQNLALNLLQEDLLFLTGSLGKK